MSLNSTYLCFLRADTLNPTDASSGWKPTPTFLCQHNTAASGSLVLEQRAKCEELPNNFLETSGKCYLFSNTVKQVIRLLKQQSRQTVSIRFYPYSLEQKECAALGRRCTGLKSAVHRRAGEAIRDDECTVLLNSQILTQKTSECCGNALPWGPSQAGQGSFSQRLPRSRLSPRQTQAHALACHDLERGGARAWLAGPPRVAALGAAHWGRSLHEDASGPTATASHVLPP